MLDDIQYSCNAQLCNVCRKTSKVCVDSHVNVVIGKEQGKYNVMYMWC